jgi:hypothetical protein
MVRRIPINGIDQQVDINDDHLRKENFRLNSSSSMAVAAHYISSPDLLS